MSVFFAIPKAKNSPIINFKYISATFVHFFKSKYAENRTTGIKKYIMRTTKVSSRTVTP